MQSLLEAALSNAILACVPALLALVVGLFSRRPALVHALWLLVLIKLITPPLFRVSIPWPNAPVPVAAAPEIEAAPDVPHEHLALPLTNDGAEPIPEFDVFEVELAVPPSEKVENPPATLPSQTPTIGWPELIAALWLAGSLAWFTLALRRAWLFSDALRPSSPGPPGLCERIAELSRLVGLASAPEVRLVPARVTPMVWGVFHPLLLLPAGLKEQVGEQGADTLAVHELAHIRRGDHWVRVLEFVVLGLFWWHPLVWLARRELRQAEERCCDAWVVRVLPGSARAYAVALVDALDFLSDSSPVVPPLACGIGEVADLKRRLKMILRSATPHRLGLTAGLVVLAFAVFLLPLVPALAQEEREKPRPREEPGQRASDEEKHIERMKDELRKRMEEVERLRHQIEKTMRDRELARQHKEKEQPRGGHVIRIEISGLGGNPEEIERLVKTLEKMLPGKERRILVLRGGQPGPRPQPGQPRIELKLRRPGQPAQPMNLPRGGDDKRIEGLEKKFEAIMRELESLRAEMKRRGPERR